MAHSAHRRTRPTSARHRFRRWLRRSPAARHLPFVTYALITFVFAGWTLVEMCRATG